MVSKVAVIALVAIVACPILLGYAMNLTEVTETDYRLSDDVLNVTPLLQDGYEYSYAAANVTDLNSRFYEAGAPSVPDYVRMTTTKTPLQLTKKTTVDVSPLLADFSYYSCVFDYNPAGGYVTLTITWNDDTTSNVIGFHSAYWIAEDHVLYVTKYMYSGGSWHEPDIFGIFDNVKKLSFSRQTGYSGNELLYYYWNPGHPATYVDLAAGFYLNKYDNNVGTKYTSVELPDYSNNVLVTMDLSTITSSSYSFDMGTNGAGTYRFVKTTDSGGAHWKLQLNSGGGFQDLTNLYYDSSKTSNTYQIFLDLKGTTFRYVGGWPTIMGTANSYWDYTYTYPSPVNRVTLSFSNGVTPQMRIDAADYRAYKFPIIEDETYDPSQFRSNPATTIGSPSIYGSSITFGGNTYTVSEGNITLGSHQIPVKGLVFSSVPVAGGYENRIGNTVVSTTVTPSTITFNGKWSANITTVSMESYTYTKTDWTPGEFGWNGIDQNFLMVGLLTSLGVFIALGIYIRRTKANLWPLLLVCGGAAMLFFCML